MNLSWENIASNPELIAVLRLNLLSTGAGLPFSWIRLPDVDFD
jgi:hypothetical protein